MPETLELRHRAALDAYERRNYEEALRLALALIDDNFHHANALAGVLYEDGGHGVEQDFQKARFYYERATETVGSLEGWLGLGRLYFFGKGVPKDLERAAGYYAIVDEDADNAVAKLMLGRIYGDPLGPFNDAQRAREYLVAAAERGNVSANAHLAMLERRQGNWPLSLGLHAKAVALAFSISMRDPADSRLRQC